MTALSTILALTVGNFAYQVMALFEPTDWAVAAERSFFQASAILLYAWFSK